MAERYVKITREKLENFFAACGFSKRVAGKELVFVRANQHYSDVWIKVYTSLPADGGDVRGKGQDAIRVAAAYESDVPFRDRGKSFGIYKAQRVFRTGTEEAILDRLYERMREAYAFTNEWLRRNWTHLPQQKRDSAPAAKTPSEKKL